MESIQLVNTYEEGTDFETIIPADTKWVSFKEKGTNLAVEHYENPKETYLMVTKPLTNVYKQNYWIKEVPSKPGMKTISTVLYGKERCWQLFKDQIIMKECHVEDSMMFKFFTEKPSL